MCPLLTGFTGGDLQKFRGGQLIGRPPRRRRRKVFHGPPKPLVETADRQRPAAPLAQFREIEHHGKADEKRNEEERGNRNGHGYLERGYENVPECQVHPRPLCRTWAGRVLRRGPGRGEPLPSLLAQPCAIPAGAWKTRRVGRIVGAPRDEAAWRASRQRRHTGTGW